MSGQRDIRLLLADVDGTLVTQDKVLTDQTVAVAQELREAGITLAITSGRPPRGMSMLIAPLKLEGAIAGFNGGVFVHPDLSVIESHMLDFAAAKETLQLILDQGLDAWVYTEKEWLIRDSKAPHVARETWTVKFDAKVVASFTDAHLADAVKIVGVSDDLDRVAACEKLAQQKLGSKRQCGAFAALLSRCHPSAGQQGRGGIDAVKAAEHSARADGDDRGHAERRSDVPQQRDLDRHGQCQRRGQVAGDRGDRQQSKRGLCQRGAKIHSAAPRTGNRCVSRRHARAHSAACLPLSQHVEGDCGA